MPKKDTRPPAHLRPWPKRAGPGCPTTYTPEKAQAVFDLMSEGYSERAALGLAGIPQGTWHNWLTKSQVEVMQDGYDVAKALRAAHWEKIALDGASEHAPTVIVAGLRSAAAEEWKDRQEVAHTGANGESLPIIQVRFVKAEGEA